LPFVFKLLLNANNNLALYVNSDDEKSQLVGTTWLLSMLGFMHMNFGIIQSDDERLYDGKSTKGAVDTIAFGNNGVLAIDATHPKKRKSTRLEILQVISAKTIDSSSSYDNGITFYAKYDEGKYQYLVLNYDKFSQEDSPNLILNLAKQKVDNVVLDEIHFVKRRDEESSQRRKTLMAL
jgi:hypothetical protein